MQVLFDTNNKKPKVWNILILSVVVAAVIGILALCVGGRTADIAVSVIFDLYFAAVIVLLLDAFVKQLRYNPYSYNTIYYMGFALFLVSVLIIGCMHTVRLVRSVDGMGAKDLIPVLQRSAQTYLLFTFPFILVFSIGLAISNISLIRHEGRRLVNVLGIVLAFLLVGGEILLTVLSRLEPENLRVAALCTAFVNLFSAVYLYFECMLIGTIIANIIVVRYEPEKDKDYIVILGCGLRKDGTPTPLLQGRIDRALRFREAQLSSTAKELFFVVSGGQGSDEVISESASMKRYLLEKGIPEERIIEEDASTTTYENMEFSKEKILEYWKKGKAVLSCAKKEEEDFTAKRKEGEAFITEKNAVPGKVLFATTNYHVFRAGLMARRVKIRAQGIGAKTKWYFWPNAAVREFVGLLTEHRVKQVLIFGGIIVIYTILAIAAM
ncbi:MAG: YdcF family protein [Clostridiales bacterium]|nr:YdcF family protein [Clostridiales bacterium]